MNYNTFLYKKNWFSKRSDNLIENDIIGGHDYEKISTGLKIGFLSMLTNEDKRRNSLKLKHRSIESEVIQSICLKVSVYQQRNNKGL